MTLELIAAKLEGLEETIIYKLMDRAQFKKNDIIYRSGESGFDDEKSGMSLFDIRLLYTETMDSEFGRFMQPEERAFFKNLPEPKRVVTNYKDDFLNIDNFDSINLTADIKKAYLKILNSLCLSGDDGQFGSSVEHDIFALQALARRIHFGSLYVAESKFRDNPESYSELIEKEDTGALMDLLTRADVEERILQRVKEKVIHIQSRINEKVRRRIDPDLVLDFYRTYIIPLTKKGEILYLLKRKR